MHNVFIVGKDALIRKEMKKRRKEGISTRRRKKTTLR